MRAERCVASSNPALSATKARDERAFALVETALVEQSSNTGEWWDLARLLESAV